MATITLPFNNGNPFTVGPAGTRSASVNLPATVTSATIALTDPSGDWVRPVNAGGNFQYGVEYTPDGGTTWKVLCGNGTGQPVGSLTRQGNLPSVSIDSNGLGEAYGKPCRAFAICTPRTISVGATATITT